MLFRSNNDLILKSGAWFSYGDTRIGQGRENAKQFLKDNPDITNELDKKLREMFNLELSKSNTTSDDTQEND